MAILRSSRRFLGSVSVAAPTRANIWVPNYISTSVTVVRASSGLVLRTLTGNGSP